MILMMIHRSRLVEIVPRKPTRGSFAEFMLVDIQFLSCKSFAD